MKRMLNRFNWKYWVPLVGMASLSALFFRTFVLTPVEVVGNSMEPALHDGNEVLVRKYGKVKRFDFRLNLRSTIPLTVNRFPQRISPARAAK